MAPYLCSIELLSPFACAATVNAVHPIPKHLLLLLLFFIYFLLGFRLPNSLSPTSHRFIELNFYLAFGTNVLNLFLSFSLSLSAAQLEKIQFY